MEEKSGPEVDAPGVIALPPVIYLAGLVAGVALSLFLPAPSLPGVARIPVGALLVALGGALVATFSGAFRRAGTAMDPREASTALVTGGPYRVTRNPAYLGMALLYSGIALLVGALWAFVTLVPTLAVVDRGVIAREERYLERKFGDEYRAFKARTRRWV